MSKQRLGANPFEENKGVDSLIQDTRKTASQKTIKRVKQQASKPASQQGTKKATYYIRPELIKELKLLSINRDKDQSKLVIEAIEDLLKKYKGKLLNY